MVYTLILAILIPCNEEIVCGGRGRIIRWVRVKFV